VVVDFNGVFKREHGANRHWWLEGDVEIDLWIVVGH